MMNYLKKGSLAIGCALTLCLSACKKEYLNEPANYLNDSFKESLLAGKETIFKNIIYGNNLDYRGRNQTLRMDIYLPQKASSASKSNKYPVLLLVHGGGFQTGDKSQTASFAKLMNEKGFTVATINYRLGWQRIPTNKCDNSMLKSSEAVYRALQDTRASLRFIAANADKYQLDTNWIFAGGSSAGAVSVLNAAYYTDAAASDNFPGYSKKFGPIDASNSLKNVFAIKSIVNMWGAIDDLDLISKKTAIPTISFHGAQDDVVNFNVGYFFSCNKTRLGYGSKPIYDKLTSMSISAVAHIDPVGGHGVYDENFQVNNISCFLNNVIKNRKQTGFFYNLDGDCGENLK